MLGVNFKMLELLFTEFQRTNHNWFWQLFYILIFWYSRNFWVDFCHAFTEEVQCDFLKVPSCLNSLLKNENIYIQIGLTILVKKLFIEKKSTVKPLISSLGLESKIHSRKTMLFLTSNIIPVQYTLFKIIVSKAHYVLNI